jgi:hypothetical protein
MADRRESALRLTTVDAMSADVLRTGNARAGLMVTQEPGSHLHFLW